MEVMAWARRMVLRARMVFAAPMSGAARSWSRQWSRPTIHSAIALSRWEPCSVVRSRQDLGDSENRGVKRRLGEDVGSAELCRELGAFLHRPHRRFLLVEEQRGEAARGQRARPGDGRRGVSVERSPVPAVSLRQESVVLPEWPEAGGDLERVVSLVGFGQAELQQLLVRQVFGKPGKRVGGFVTKAERVGEGLRDESAVPQIGER